MHLVNTAIKLVTGSLLNCSNEFAAIPPAKDFLTHLTPAFVLAIIIGSILCLMTLIIGITHALYISIYVTHPYRRAFVSYLAGTAPFVSAFALVSLFMPRVWFLAHLMSFFYFSIGLYFVICLLMNLVEGRHTIVKKMGSKSSRLSVATPPFCCVFPCLPTLEIETRKIQFCEIMVMQTPIVRLFATLVSLILFFEYQDGAILALKILDTICVPSLLAGIYGCHILVTTISKLDELVPFRYIVVFRLLDIFLMFFGMQQPIFDFLARAGVFGCGTILPPLETAFFWKNFLVIVESFIVSLISTALLKPSRSALFDKYPASSASSAASVTSMSTQESTA
uniref:Organic solute transporter alpha-like protein n=1 Tax=Panagrellus redivivus TaxID=6233 RepID=A0A7E4W9J4_PANRE